VPRKKENELLGVYLFRSIGMRRGTRAASFLVAWGIYSDSLGPEGSPNMYGYESFWGISTATAYRERADFLRAFPGENTPERIWQLIRPNMLDIGTDRDQATGKVLAVTYAWAS
jgi:hypothetical protein